MFDRMSRASARRWSLAGAVLPAVAVLVLPLSVAAQPPPSRIGNIWDNLPHQPTQGDVSAAEQQQGVAPPPQQQRAIDSDIDQLYHQLLGTEQHDQATNGH